MKYSCRASVSEILANIDILIYIDMKYKGKGQKTDDLFFGKTAALTDSVEYVLL